MSILVEQQDEQINTIEATAAVVEKDVETGCVFYSSSGVQAIVLTYLFVMISLQHTEKAVDSARAARKKRWICFFIIVIILVIIGIVVGIEVAKNKN